MLAFSVREALRQAAAAFGPAGTSVDLASPATPEAVYWAMEGAVAVRPLRAGVRSDMEWMKAVQRLRASGGPASW